jgi:selenium metabolism protein YedF
MITVNAMGDACPIPVVKTKKAIDALTADETVEVLVDNETAVENVSKAARSMGYEVANETLGDKQYKVTVKVLKGAASAAEDSGSCECDCGKKNVVVVIGTNKMGTGNDELGQALIKSFVYALTQQDELPSSVLLYNGGVNLSCEGSPVLEDLQKLVAEGVSVMSCGTCLNFCGLTEKLSVGEVTNMYEIIARQMKADVVIKP